MIRDRRALTVKIVLTLACVVTPLIAQTPPSLTYPKPHTGDVVDDYFGTWVADEDVQFIDAPRTADARDAARREAHPGRLAHGAPVVLLADGSPVELEGVRR